VQENRRAGTRRIRVEQKVERLGERSGFQMQRGFGQLSITLSDEPALAVLDDRRAISTSRDNEYPSRRLLH
jgi:hypothetical protein